MNRKKELELKLDRAREHLRIAHERYEITLTEYVEYMTKEDKVK